MATNHRDILLNFRVLSRICLTATGVASLSAGGQSPDSIASNAWRMRACAEATSAIGNPDSLTARNVAAKDTIYRLLTTMYGCPEDGPVALIRFWDSSPSDTTILSLLTAVTSQIRDRRLLDKMTGIASSPERPRRMRLSAMAALVSYFDPYRFVDFPAVDDVTLPTRSFVRRISHTDPSIVMGLRPLDKASAQSSVLATLTTLGADSDQRVSGVATALAKWLIAGLAEDSVAIQRAVGVYLRANFKGVLAFDPDLSCATRASCVAEAKSGLTPAVVSQRARLHAAMMESAGGLVTPLVTPLLNAGTCTDGPNKNCRLVSSDAFFRVSEPLIHGDTAMVLVRVNRNMGTEPNSYVTAEEYQLEISRSGERWVVSSKRLISRA